MHEQYKRCGEHFGYRRKIFDRVVRKFFEKLRALGMRRKYEQERIAIGGCLGYEIGADNPGRRRTIINDDRLAEPLAEPCHYEASGVIAAATGRERNDDPHRARWIRLSDRGHAGD